MSPLFKGLFGGSANAGKKNGGDARAERKGPADKAYEAKLVDILLDRGVEQVFPSKEMLRAKLSGTKKLKIYAGIDPTGPTLHFGHAIVLKKLMQFQQLGHEVILLIGDFTAQVGDPTDKLAVRKPLTTEEIKKNLTLYKTQAEKFIDFSGKNPAKVVHNSTWLKSLDLSDILKLSSLVTVDQMLKRDMFAKRMEEGKPVFLHEFLYPLMQGYDSVMLGVDVEIGGNDQMFNMLMGRDLQKKMNDQDKVAITMKLLTDSSGKKMGKTEGNMVSLTDSSFDMFGKIMSWTDGMILAGFELCTDVSEGELNKIKEILNDASSNPRDLKVRLAKEIVGFYYGAKKADEAEENFVNTFSKKGVSEDATVINAQTGAELSKLLLDAGVIESIGEFKRLVKEKAVSQEDGSKIDDFNFKVAKSETIKVGKRRFAKIVLG